ncbi:MAG: LacI family DNA-binding transcriptional regulator [Acidobacteriota bacterium]|nr:LacI family DNA-binding transcriptional regulator [Acidobacteriota bacterium]
MRPPNMQDVANLAGVSQRTVSNVVNNYVHVSDKTREKVQDAIRELGYRPNVAAQRLRSGRTGMIALAVPNISWPYFAELAHLIQREAQEFDQTLLIVETNGVRDRELKALEGFRRDVIDGVIYSPIVLTGDELPKIDVPLVLLGEKISDVGFPHFSVDGEAAGYAIAEHLLQCGARKFVVVGSSATVMTMGPGPQRRRGIERALEANGLRLTADSVVESPWTYEGAHDALTAWLTTHDLPDAIIALNDIAAAGSVRALADIGARVPEDVLVTGWDDTDVASYTLPSLTAISPDKTAIAKKSVSALMELINTGNTDASEETVDFELVVRESSTRQAV